MPTWNSEQYLKYASERTQPSIDLAMRVRIAAPARVIDLGCGPGNSTEVVRRRWPQAEVVGLDNSPAMLAQARQDYPNIQWIESSISDWRVADNERPFDVVFTNAALQWVPDHRREFPRLFSQVAPGGAFAVQVPANLDSPAQRLIGEVAQSPSWRDRFPKQPRSWFVHAPEFYYDLLAPHAKHLDLWTTDYYHILPNLDGIIEWYRGTGLRPWLDALPDEETRQHFLGAYRARLVAYYSERPDGRVLFPFRRLFVIAYR